MAAFLLRLRRKGICFVLGVLIIPAASCNYNMYTVGDPAYVPHLVKTGSVEAAGGMRLGRATRSYTGDLAVSPLKHVGLMGSYRKLENDLHQQSSYGGGSSTESQTLNGYSWVAGAGWYGTLSPDWSGAVYAGIGGGHLERRYANRSSGAGGSKDPAFDAGYRRYWIQPSLTQVLTRHQSLTVGARYSLQRVDELYLPYQVSSANSMVEESSSLINLFGAFTLSSGPVFAQARLGVERGWGLYVDEKIDVVLGAALGVRIGSRTSK